MEMYIPFIRQTINLTKFLTMNRFNVRKPLLSVVMLCAMGIVGCKDDSTAGGGQPYDPSKPIELTDFYPKEGKYQEKVILQGSNFGTDPSAIRVYFNQRPAAVIGTTGSEIYVQAPRLPGDECKLSVVIGEDSVVYNDIFLYESSMTVATVVGNGTKIYKAGTLAEAQVSPYYCCVDESGNVFVISRNGDEGDVSTIARIDEVNSELVTLASNTTGNVPCVDPETQVVSFATETTIGSFMTLDPKEMWAPRYREMKWPAGIPAQITNGYKHCMVVNPDDGYIYCRFYFGQVVRIDPKSYETTVIAVTPQGDSYGLSFNPQHPNILYITMDSNGLAYETPQGTLGTANSICCIDVSAYNGYDDPAEAQAACLETFERLSSPQTSGGHRDGKLENAQLRRPFQMFCDNDGNMYIADCDNQCIRRMVIDRDNYRTGTVETVLGMPGTAGWQDGTEEEALFQYPRGIGIAEDGTVYVADYGNARIRKLSIN